MTNALLFRVVLGVAFFGHAVAALFYAHIIGDESARRIVYFGSKIVVNAIPLIWVFGVERRPFRFPRPTRSALVPGIATGVLVGGLLVALYYTVFAGRLNVEGLLAKAGAYGALDHFFLFALFLCVGNSGLEEYYWRWFVFGRLRRMTGVSPAVLLSALGFTLHHIVVLSAYFPDVGLVILFNAGVFAGGCVWAMVYKRCDSIYGPWISHFLVDAGIMVIAYDLLFSTP